MEDFHWTGNMTVGATPILHSDGVERLSLYHTTQYANPVSQQITSISNHINFTNNVLLENMGAIGELIQTFGSTFNNINDFLFNNLRSHPKKKMAPFFISSQKCH